MEQEVERQQEVEREMQRQQDVEREALREREHYRELRLQRRQEAQFREEQEIDNNIEEVRRLRQKELRQAAQRALQLSLQNNSEFGPRMNGNDEAVEMRWAEEQYDRARQQNIDNNREEARQQQQREQR